MSETEEGGGGEGNPNKQVEDCSCSSINTEGSRTCSHAYIYTCAYVLGHYSLFFSVRKGSPPGLTKTLSGSTRRVMECLFVSCL